MPAVCSVLFAIALSTFVVITTGVAPMGALLTELLFLTLAITTTALIGFGEAALASGRAR